MISVFEALKIVSQYSNPLEKISKKTTKSFGYIVAEDVISPLNMPPFRQSSMDGYAFINDGNPHLNVIGEVQTGSAADFAIKSGEAVRIFTGARVPDCADTIIMQENVERINDKISIEKMPQHGENVRPTGEQIQSGAIALKKGTFLNEAAVGFLAGLGITHIKVYRKPKVGLLITGNEIKNIGEQLEEGEIFDSNSITLKLALKRLGIKNITIEFAKDTLKDTNSKLKSLLKSCDVILISGGISVGDYDFVQESLVQNGAEELFYKVNQKPGKPLWFGKKGETIIFALPGNPASSLACFYIYVWALIKAKMGFLKNNLPSFEAITSKEINNKFGKTLFLKGNIDEGVATELSGQASSMLKSFAISNALLIVPENVEKIKEGETITYLKLD